MTPLWFVLAAGVGAAARHGINELGKGWIGTLAINVSGAFVLGWLVASQPSAAVLTVIGTGFCGAFTTFSTLALEATEGTTERRVVIVVVTLALGLAAAAAGWALG